MANHNPVPYYYYKQADFDTNDYIITVSKAIYDDANSLVGVLAMDIKLSLLIDIAVEECIDFADNIVLDMGDTLITTFNESGQMVISAVMSNGFASDLRSEGEGNIAIGSNSPEKMNIIKHKMILNDWYLTHAIHARTYSLGTTNVAFPAVLALALILIIIITLLYLILQKVIISPIETINKDLEEATGIWNIGGSKAHKKDEIKGIAQQYSSLVNELSSTKSDIEGIVRNRSKELSDISMMFEQSYVSLVMTNADGIIIYANPLSAKNLNMSKDDMLGKA